MFFPDLLDEYEQLLQEMKNSGITSGAIYTEIKQAIEWMQTGYDPAEYRAVTRIDAYPTDPYHMQTYMAYVNDDDMLMPEFLLPIKQQIEDEFFVDIDMEAEEWQFYIEHMMRDVNAAAKRANERKEKINSALQGLTSDERAVFIAIAAEGMSYSKVAEMLNVKKGTVQSYMERAQKKITNNIERGSQLSLFVC